MMCIIFNLRYAVSYFHVTFQASSVIRADVSVDLKSSMGYKKSDPR